MITHDSIAEGVHFLPSDPAGSVGWKLVAVNLSDLAGKGASPAAAVLSLTIGSDSIWDEAFLTGVEAACTSYGLPLIGGDTIALPDGAPRVFGLTAIGRAGPRTPSRGGASPRDRLWLVGTVGDSAAGLAQLLTDRKSIGLLVDSYRQPIPQLVAALPAAARRRARPGAADGGKPEDARCGGGQSDGVAADQRQAIAGARRLDPADERIDPVAVLVDGQRQQSRGGFGALCGEVG